MVVNLSDADRQALADFGDMVKRAEAANEVAQACIAKAETVAFELATLLKHAEEIKAEAQPITIIEPDPRAVIDNMRRIVAEYDERHNRYPEGKL